MMGDDDRPSYIDRDKKSFSERDRMRRERRNEGERPPRSPAAQARASQASKQYLKEIDGFFSSPKGGAEGEKLEQAVLEAHGTAGLADACRAYLERVGAPTGTRLISCFLDTGVTELVLAGFEALRALQESGSLEVTAGLRTQLRMLAQDLDDDVAEAAEDLLESI
jgi:hypothetical protein